MLPRPDAVDAAVESPADVPIVEDDHLDDVSVYLPSWLASMVVHLALVLLLALVTVVGKRGDGLSDLLISVDSSAANGSLENLDSQMSQTSELELQSVEVPSELPVAPPLDETAPSIALVEPVAAPPGQVDIAPPAAAIGTSEGGNSLEMRLDPTNRAYLLQSEGGTAQSEAAVERALHWLAEHQRQNGSWTFQHDKHPDCAGACGNPGFTPGNIAATAMALLPFLGNGQTHLEGKYQKNVELGLKHLVSSVETRGDLGSLYEQGGQMYGHGLAAIALCEAYGMTHDKFLHGPAQAVVNFISEAQDPVGGGWRYMPRQPGDTSVVGWQLMALKSAQMAYLRVPPGVMRKAGYFLDRVQSDRGAVYGYQAPERGRPATTAIGLLCRIYLGWKHEEPPLVRGISVLSTLGPSIEHSRLQNNMYYNYYATQVLHHYGGEDWKRWNNVMRDYLIDTQATDGHEAGSWFFAGSDHGTGAGGRLYCTALAAMTLEVYYRYMPLYRPQTAPAAVEPK